MSTSKFERLQYEPTYNYRPGVRIGKWHEETFHYVKEKHEHVSKYSLDYYPKEFLRDVKEYRNNYVIGEGTDPRILFDHEGEKYHNNYTTTYDVSFNILKQDVPKRYNTRLHCNVPQQDYALNHGNHTNYGFKEYKKQEWQCDDVSKMRPLTSEYMEEYLRPSAGHYGQQHCGIPRRFSSKLYPPNTQNVDLKTRGRQGFLVPDPVVAAPPSRICPLFVRRRHSR